MLRVKRRYGAATSYLSKFTLLPQYKLKCGLEIHTQLNTANKLFSLSTNDPFHSSKSPNSLTSHFDIALPGTQPKLNYEAVLLGLKLSVALNCKINLNSHFDRKHYFYGDQPLGYQITQHFSPFASDGQMPLWQDIDDIDTKSKNINIIQLQIEQDTGKSLYKDVDKITLIDLNRSNVPLIEMVTEPDFSDLKEIRAFIKKYQNLVRHLDISTGDLETGAMRVDVNMSINEFARVELKNLPNTSAIMNAIKYEYQRQVKIIKDGGGMEHLSSAETRGWNGSSTVKLRSKETTIDYRYMPDPELPSISLSPDAIESIAKRLPPIPDEILNKLTHEPYNLSLKDAKILTISSNSQVELYTHEELRNYYFDTFHSYNNAVLKEKIGKVKPKLPINWIVHELLGDLNKLKIPLLEAKKVLTPQKLKDFLILIHKGDISSASGKLLLFHILEMIKKENFSSEGQLNLEKLISQYDLATIKAIDSNDLQKLCQDIITQVNDDRLISDIASGKRRNSLKFLIGQGMRYSQGRIKAQEFDKMFKKILNITY
ncbi:hypothetical protein HG535_0E04500 [Zygotorulaspora mrakii]|uniref:Glutamyl-tRNA(Gln) amidotransferase subunit B, mitochondrial n=1 Tax=Zygotorulaspora mrakii TaxID=42260 RepID=A0A7H9B4R6_ZYGMR|nr:uncharacterized protein HG535_0E04500 [Zygotorulaspora mrakii]QLG73366.1 hypothetical protein HG535_0E04500 [Zygotorulaspora mrakii]